MMQKPLRKIYLLLAGLSLCITTAVILLIFHNLTPYRMQVINKQNLDACTEKNLLFHDFDHDGFPERFEVTNESKRVIYYIKIYQDYKRGLIDQFNLDNPIEYTGIAFHDLNGDGHDELFAFSHDNDSLYLSIIDIAHITFIWKERPILPASPRRTRKHWDFKFMNPKFADLDGNGHLQLLFTIVSGYSHYPRALYVFDFTEQKIVKKFEHHMGVSHVLVTDLNNDGKPEIALTGSATNNFDKNVFLSDAYSWFVLLDQNLKPLRPFLRTGGKFSSLLIHKLYFGKEQRIVFFQNNPEENYPLKIIGRDFSVIRKRTFSSQIQSMKVDNIGKQPFIYVSSRKLGIALLDSNLNIVRRTKKRFLESNIVINRLADFLPQKGKELLCSTASGLFLFDHNLKLQAKFLFKQATNVEKAFCVKKPAQKLPDFVFTNAVGFYRLELLPEAKYGNLLWFFLGIFALTFLLAFTVFWGYQKLNQYFSYFFFSLKESDNAIILLNFRGLVVSVNEKVNRFLRLNPALRRGQFLPNALLQRPSIVQAYKDAKNTGQQIKRSFSFEDEQGTFVGEIAVTPFFTIFNFAHTFLIEIKDSTQQVLTERQRNWQRNVRKMVHDIKTPIGDVQLKLQTIFLKIMDKYPGLDSDIIRELEESHTELKRIRKISKDFLKFSDLEEIQIEEIDIKDFLEKAISPFQLYTSDRLKMNTKIHPHLPEKVFWDSRQIELLLHILIENSIDALQGEGEITIEIRIAESPKNDGSTWLMLRIQDNGSGIPSEYQEKIFEPHFSTKTEGTGLGLSFAKHIVQQHGGEIHFHSDGEKGTIFIVLLPSEIKQK